jgi:phage gp36-like protein
LIPTQELAELTTESGEVPDTAVISECIALTDAEIDSYLTMRYALLLATTPARVKALSQDMAIYHLYSRRGIMPEIRKDKYN